MLRRQEEKKQRSVAITVLQDVRELWKLMADSEMRYCNLAAYGEDHEEDYNKVYFSDYDRDCKEIRENYDRILTYTTELPRDDKRRARLLEFRIGALYRKGNLYTENGSHDKAIPCYDEALELMDQNHMDGMWYEYVDIFLKQGRGYVDKREDGKKIEECYRRAEDIFRRVQREDSGEGASDFGQNRGGAGRPGRSAYGELSGHCYLDRKRRMLCEEEWETVFHSDLALSLQLAWCVYYNDAYDRLCEESNAYSKEKRNLLREAERHLKRAEFLWNEQGDRGTQDSGLICRISSLRSDGPGSDLCFWLGDREERRYKKFVTSYLTTRGNFHIKSYQLEQQRKRETGGGEDLRDDRGRREQEKKDLRNALNCLMGAYLYDPRNTIAMDELTVIYFRYQDALYDCFRGERSPEKKKKDEKSLPSLAKRLNFCLESELKDYVAAQLCQRLQRELVEAVQDGLSRKLEIDYDSVPEFRGTWMHNLLVNGMRRAVTKRYLLSRERENLLPLRQRADETACAESLRKLMHLLPLVLNPEKKPPLLMECDRNLLPDRMKKRVEELDDSFKQVRAEYGAALGSVIERFGKNYDNFFEESDSADSCEELVNQSIKVYYRERKRYVPQIMGIYGSCISKLFEAVESKPRQIQRRQGICRRRNSVRLGRGYAIPVENALGKSGAFALLLELGRIMEGGQTRKSSRQVVAERAKDLLTEVLFVESRNMYALNLSVLIDERQKGPTGRGGEREEDENDILKVYTSLRQSTLKRRLKRMDDVFYGMNRIVSATELKKTLIRLYNLVSGFTSGTIVDIDRLDTSFKVGHYTKLEALPKLLTDTAISSLRLSNMLYLNDPREGRIMIDLLESRWKKSFEDQKKEQKKSQKKSRGRCERIGDKILKTYLSGSLQSNYVYIGCFTGSMDTLPMWDRYGNGGDGAYLRVSPQKSFDKQQCIDLGYAYMADSESTYVSMDSKYALYRVIYYPDSKNGDRSLRDSLEELKGSLKKIDLNRYGTYKADSEEFESVRDEAVQKLNSLSLGLERELERLKGQNSAKEQSRDAGEQKKQKREDRHLEKFHKQCQDAVAKLRNAMEKSSHGALKSGLEALEEGIRKLEQEDRVIALLDCISGELKVIDRQLGSIRDNLEICGEFSYDKWERYQREIVNIFMLIFDQARFLLKSQYYVDENEYRVIKYSSHPKSDSSGSGIPRVYIEMKRPLEYEEICLGPKVALPAIAGAYILDINRKAGERDVMDQVTVRKSSIPVQ